ncbi:MAG: asparagine synthase (glutamine-hydrolyzing) [Chitinispirillaceae bacterium]|nr:asparagine synthase (glutamine-hydrolyzing) [Chitinispirillaceae bacterium]
MCGICGFAGTGSDTDLHRMNATQVHRGPDAGGEWTDPDNAVYLGHRRLSIIDLAGGAQPMATPDGNLAVTFNGEIYNYQELRRELQDAGHRFATSHSDTEVLLHGYRAWGNRLPEKLNGMWAFTLYDREKKQLFASRDRFGKKPFFYWHTGNLFAFSSEATALLAHSRIRPSISRPGLMKLFAYNYVPAPHSIYEGVRKLPAGHNLVFDIASGSCTIERYWEFVLEPMDKIPRNPEQEWGEVIRDLLRKAVERRLMSDVPLGVFLSGGMDSSSVAYFAGKTGGYDSVKTFSIGFGEKSFDESSWSGLMAKRLGTDHHHTVLSMEKGCSLLPSIAERLDEPLGDGSLLATFLLCQETRKRVTVAVGGDGADELFAGYDPFRALRLAALYDRMVPKPLHRALSLIASRLPTSHANMSLDFKLKRTLRGLCWPRKLWNPIWLGALDPASLQDLMGEPVDIESVYSEAIEAWDACKQNDPVSKTLQFYTRLYLTDDILVKVDRSSMLNSLEVRAPYLDIELVDFVRKIPWNYKYRNGQTKYILKKALEPILPRETIYRSKKGFGVPVGRWFKQGQLRIDPENPKFELLNSKEIQKAVTEHTMGKHDHRALLWNLYLLQNR